MDVETCTGCTRSMRVAHRMRSGQMLCKICVYDLIATKADPDKICAECSIVANDTDIFHTCEKCANVYCNRCINNYGEYCCGCDHVRCHSCTDYDPCSECDRKYCDECNSSFTHDPHCLTLHCQNCQCITAKREDKAQWCH